MDTSAYFVTTLKPEIKRCTEKVIRAASDWAHAQGLTIAALDPRPGDAVLHATANDLDGFLEVTYVVTTTGPYTRARATLWFYTYQASRLEPTVIAALLAKRKVAELEDAVQQAIRCDVA